MHREQHLDRVCSAVLRAWAFRIELLDVGVEAIEQLRREA
jgi:hypothetical protein